MFKAKLASPSALAWQDSTSRAVTHSIHDRSCTLLNDEAKLLSVVLPEIGPGPFSVVIDRDGDLMLPADRPFSNLYVGAAVTIGENMINIDGVLIDTKDAETWTPRLEWEGLDHSKFHNLRPELRRNLLLYGAPGSLIVITSDGTLDRAQTQLFRCWLKIANGLRKFDLEGVRVEIGRIAGLGIGLTPAGDDFLVGVIMAIWFFTPLPEAKGLTMEIASAVSGKTTLLSQAYIDAAAWGEAGQAWHELIKAIASGNKQHLQEATIQLIRTGSTSGSDALTGFLLASEILEKTIENNR